MCTHTYIHVQMHMHTQTYMRLQTQQGPCLTIHTELHWFVLPFMYSRPCSQVAKLDHMTLHPVMTNHYLIYTSTNMHILGSSDGQETVFAGAMNEAGTCRLRHPPTDSRDPILQATSRGWKRALSTQQLCIPTEWNQRCPKSHFMSGRTWANGKEPWGKSSK